MREFIALSAFSPDGNVFFQGELSDHVSFGVKGTPYWICSDPKVSNEASMKPGPGADVFGLGIRFTPAMEEFSKTQGEFGSK